MIVDRKPSPVVGVDTHILGAAYVDNFLICGSDTNQVDSTLDKVISLFDSLGLATHEKCPAAQIGESVRLSGASSSGSSSSASSSFSACSFDS